VSVYNKPLPKEVSREMDAIILPDADIFTVSAIWLYLLLYN